MCLRRSLTPLATAALHSITLPTVDIILLPPGTLQPTHRIPPKPRTIIVNNHPTHLYGTAKNRAPTSGRM